MDSGMTAGATPVQGALDGIRVLGLTRLLPGASCAQLLGGLGTDVIRIEQPGEGDYNRKFAPINKKESGSFLLLDRNKRSLTLNLKAPEGREIFLRLVADADVVTEGFRPGVMDSPRLGYEELRKANPKSWAIRMNGLRSWPGETSSERRSPPC